MTQQDDLLDQLQGLIDYRFCDLSLLHKAMTHSSLSPEGYRSYERLEFLGDAVVSLVVGQKFFESPARYSEGEMTEMKSGAVSRRSMAQAGGRLNLGECLRVDSGLARREERPPSLIADAYEALIGAVFLDGGFAAASELVLCSLGPEISAAEERRHPPNFKSILQQLVQAEGRDAPVYRTVRKVGPEHDLRFLAAAHVGGAECGTGWGKTKKDAEQEAAQSTLEQLYPGWNEETSAT